MKQKDIHLDVYNDKSILHYENIISEFKEGPQSPSALIRYNKIKKELDEGFLEELVKKPIDLTGAGLDDETKGLIYDLVFKLTSEVGRALIGLVFLQLTIKSIVPEQCIRLHKGGNKANAFSWVDGISMRTLDSSYNTPFLRKYNLLSLNKDGLFMTRSLAENYPYSRLYKAEMRGPFKEWISIVDKIEDGSINPLIALQYLLSLLRYKSDGFQALADKAVEVVSQYNITNLSQVQKLLRTFFEHTRYGARAFEVVMHAYMQAIFEMRDSGETLSPMTQMRSANKKHGNIGDIELKEGAVVTEAWDAKYGKPYLYEELDELKEKVQTNPGIMRAGFVVNSCFDSFAELSEKADEVANFTGIDIYLLTFDEWIEYQLNAYNIKDTQSQLELGHRWVIAVVESFAQKRRQLAPIDEPCDEWLNSLLNVFK